ncbi:MAG: NUDIX hydrolase [Acidobacteriota bacterium]
MRDRWISLRADSCTTPAGESVAPYYVLEYPDWVNVVPITGENEVVLVRQYRHGIGRALLELPCGAIDDSDETPVNAAKRELLEETGFASSEFVPTGVLAPNPATHSNFTHCFLATNCEKVADASPESTEDLELQLQPLPEFVDAVLRGELLQALHVGSVLFALARLGYLGSGSQ